MMRACRWATPWGLARRARAEQTGQASLELLALVPILVAVALAVTALLAGQSAREAADQAAVAAAVAQLQGSDPRAAAKAASPGWTRTRVRVAGGKVTVRVRVRLPRFVAALVEAERTVAFQALSSPSRSARVADDGATA